MGRLIVELKALIMTFVEMILLPIVPEVEFYLIFSVLSFVFGVFLTLSAGSNWINTAKTISLLMTV